jgi:hypothetical protein
MRLALVIQGVSKRTTQWYSECYCVASATKAFTLKGVQTIHCSTYYACVYIYIYIYIHTVWPLTVTTTAKDTCTSKFDMKAMPLGVTSSGYFPLPCYQQCNLTNTGQYDRFSFVLAPSITEDKNRRECTTLRLMTSFGADVRISTDLIT